MGESELQARLDAIPWAGFLTCIGSADDVPETLRRIFDSDEAVALDATHHLWCHLVSGGVTPAVASLAFPFLLEALPNATESVAIELMDIVASCMRHSDLSDEPLCESLRQLARGQRPYWAQWASSQNEEAAFLAREVLACTS